MNVIVGAGPAGLFTAYILVKAGKKVALYDQMPSAGRKFLIAGKSGLNLTHDEPIDQFSSRYFEDEDYFKELLNDFGPNDLREWAKEFGCETFTGSSGRVFPTTFRASQLLKNWMDYLKESPNFFWYPMHKLIGIKDSYVEFEFKTEKIKQDYKNLVLALGGASWQETGSDGLWTKVLNKIGVETKPFSSRNCGFNLKNNEKITQRFPVKYVEVSHENEFHRGDIMLTEYGIEGTPVYHLSHTLQKSLGSEGTVEMVIDLKPDMTKKELSEKFHSGNKKQSTSTRLQKKINLSKEAIDLLKIFSTKEQYQDTEKLLTLIKSLPLVVESARGLNEAISTAGGVEMDKIDRKLCLKSHERIYILGEMLDWDAPTGGYLLQGCFSQAFRVGQGIIK